jgi:diguanylate cyclase (GGDEF)-like protein
VPIVVTEATKLAVPLEGLGIPAALVTATLDVVSRNALWRGDLAFSDAVLGAPPLRRLIAAAVTGGTARRIGVEVEGRHVDVGVGPAGAENLAVVAVVGAGGPDALGAHDPLTGMLNADGFAAVLTPHLRPLEAQVPVLLIDLDGFFPANAVWGRPVGDRLVAAAVSRIRQVFGRADVFARVGPDHFVVACPSRALDDACAAARELIALLDEPFDLDGRSVRIGCHVGVAVGHPGDDPIGVVRRAHVAFVRTLTSGARLRVYDPEMHSSVVDEMLRYQELRSALTERRQLRVFYQPQIALPTGRIVGVEALIRWDHPSRGLLTAAEFLPDAARFGLIQDIDAWVMQQACGQLRRWRDTVPSARDLVVAVNVTADELVRADGVGRIRLALEQHRLPADALEIELTEDSILGDLDQLATRVETLRRGGVRVAIDDVGSGYASLLSLSRLPVDTLKIEGAFIQGLGTDPTSSAIVTAIISIARTLDATTVAEGVETRVQLDAVVALGADRVQGHYLTHALSALEVGQLLADPDASGTPILGHHEPDA